MRRRYTKDIVNDYGIEMTLALRLQGDKWGRDDCLTWDEEEPIVEIYLRDSDYLISEYYYTTFFEDDRGILLDGSNTDYALHHRNKVEAMDWIEDIDLPDFTPSYPNF